MRTSTPLTADDMATWRVTLYGADQRPDPSTAKEVEAAYYRTEDVDGTLRTVWKSWRHKPVYSVASDLVATIDRVTAPKRETEQRA